MYKGADVVTKIITGKIAYIQFGACSSDIDENIREDRLEVIIYNRIHFHYHNAFIIWLAMTMIETKM